MQISRSELSLLRLSDGIASAADLERLRKQYSEEELERWKRVCGVVSTCLSVPESYRVDVADQVMDHIYTVQSPEVEMKPLGISSGALAQFLTDGHEVDVTDSVMSKLGLFDEALDVEGVEQEEQVLGVEDTVITSNREKELIAQLTPDAHPDESIENINSQVSDDWSLSNVLRSALLDTNGDKVDVTGSIMQVITEPTDAVGTLPSESISTDQLSSTDTDVLAALESELNLDLEHQQELTGLQQASSMSFEHEIPSPVIANASQSLPGLEHELVVEFTEEEEFVLPESAIVREFEEDSDDELCSVEEEFVTAEMLTEQSHILETIKSVLLDGKHESIDIWGEIEKDITAPPLRLLRDVDIEVIDKVPAVEGDESKNEGAANVEFLNSKSIDADSTISKVSITVLGSFLTLAAAWVIIVLPSLLTQTTSTINTPKRIVTFEVAEVNQLEVEDLEVGTDMNVQILQGDANAPTIIFLDDMNMEPL